MSLFSMPVPLPEEPEAPGMGTDAAQNALMALVLRQQKEAEERRRAQEAAAREALAQQQRRASTLGGLSLLSSFGANPLLEGLQRTAGQQAAQLEGRAARTEAQLADLGGSGIDPLGIARLQQAGDRLRQERELAEARLAQQKELEEARIEGRRQRAAAGAAAAAQKRAEKLAELERKIVGDTRKEFEALGPVKEYRMADIAFNRVRNAVSTSLNTPGGSPASQIAAVYAVMKTFDPSTGVKEGEYATAEKAGGKIPDWLLRQYNKVLTGEFLTPKQLRDFERAAKTQLDAYRQAYEDQAMRYARLVPEGQAEKVIGEPVPTRGGAAPKPTTPERTPAAQAMPPGPGGILSLEGPTPARQRAPREEQALQWARANRGDPRAAAIFARLGVTE